jgi:hypothetical protein
MSRAVFLLGLALVGASARAEEPWQSTKSADGVRYEKRAVPGSKYFEHRAIFTIEKPPDAIFAALWKLLPTLHGPQIEKRDILRSSDDELVVHDFVKARIVSDRELTLRFTRQTSPALTIRYDLRNDLGPPPAKGRVLLPAVRGGWRIVPAGRGSEITYDSYSEPGGSVPAWLVRGPHQDQIVSDVTRLRELLR